MIKQAHKKKKHREKLDIALGRDTSAMPYSKKNKKIQKIPREHDYFMGFSEVRQKKKKKKSPVQRQRTKDISNT